MSYSGKGKGKEIADKDSSFGGKRKRDKDDDKTGRNRKNRSVLQFFDDKAGDASGYESSDDSIFGNGNLDDLFGSDTETKVEPEKVQFVPFLPKEEEMSEEELDKMLADRYKSGSGAVRYAEDSHKIQRSAHIDFSFPSVKDPIIWKIKCAVGRERHSVFCLMQKYTELRVLGTKLQIISAVSLDHVKGFIFVEAEKQADVNEACKGLCSIYLSRTSKISANEMSQLFSTRNKPNLISEGSWARVKSGTYKGDLAQVVAVNDARKKVTVKLIPRIDLQNLALKFGGGGAPKNTTIPPPRLIGLAELEEFRPLIQFRHDRDTDLTFQVIDGLMLKDGYIYKKVPLDSLNFLGVNPSENEILKFNSSQKSESNDLEWLSQLYGGCDKKRPIKSIKKSDKGGGKVEGSSSSSLPNGYEIYDLACFGRKDFGIILGFEKDNCKILKDAPEGPVVVTVDPNQLTTALSDTKFTALDQNKKTLSPGDTIKVVEGPSQGRQGIVKHIYRGVLFLTDDAEENDGYFCAKSFMCEKVKLVDDTFQADQGGASDFADCPSSPKSHMPRERNHDFEREGKDGMFSVGQTLRIRVGPLKGYLCRVLAIRYSDITVKLNSQTKIFTVKSEHLSEVRKNSTIGSSDNLDSNPAAIGNLDSSGDWMNGTGTSTESNGWNVGGATERSGWPSFPAAEAATSDQGRETNSSSWDNHPKNDAGGWGGGTDTTQNSSWGGWGQKKPETGEASGSASVQDAGGWGGGTDTTQNSSWGGWGQKKSENGEDSGSVLVQAAASSQDGSGWENNTTTNPASEWGGWDQKKPDNNESKGAEASWGKDAGPSSDTKKDDIASWGNITSGKQMWLGTVERDGISAPGSILEKTARPSEGGNSGWENKKSTSHSSEWGQKTLEDVSKTDYVASRSWGKAADVPSNSSGAECATNWENKKATAQTSWGAWGDKKSAQGESDSGGASVLESNVISGFDALGGGNSWNTPKPVGGESSWKKETEKEDSTSVWGKMKNVSETPSVAWGSENKTVLDAPSWGGGESSQQTGGWNKPSAGKLVDESFNENKMESEMDAPGGGSSWNRPKTSGGGPSWNKETEQQDSTSAWGKKKDVAENPSSGWGAQKSTAQDASGWGGGGSTEQTDSWKKPNVSSSDQRASWNKQGANSSWGQQGSESSWHKSGLHQDGQDNKSFDRESGGRWGRGRGRDQHGGRSFGGGSSSEWSKDGDSSGNSSGWKSDVGGGWDQSSTFGGRSNTSWNRNPPKDDSINSENGGRGGFDRGFRGRGRSERGGFRGRGSFEQGGSRGGFSGNRGGFGGKGSFGGRDHRGRDGNDGGWKDRDSFEQKSWNNETNSSSKAGWSKEEDPQTGGSSEWKSWSTSGANTVGSAEGSQPSGWSRGASWNSASGSKGTEGSNSQAGSWGKNDETGGWKANSTSNGGWSREPVKETAGSSVEASAGGSQSTGWGSGGTGLSGGGMNEDGGSNAQTGKGSWK